MIIAEKPVPVTLIFSDTGGIDAAKGNEATKLVVLSSILRDGEWKESTEQSICIYHFKPDGFRKFLDCLAHASNDTSRCGVILVFNSAVVREVLPVAQFYQADNLKRIIIATVSSLLKSTISDKESLIKRLQIWFSRSRPTPKQTFQTGQLRYCRKDFCE